MPYILDTHVILWILDEENRLSPKARNLVTDLSSTCFFSVASFFEMAIKKKIGKLELSKSLQEYIAEIERIGFIVMPVKSEHLDGYDKIPLINDHRDPFDRLILATAYCEKLKIISADEKFHQYSQLVEIIW